MGPAVGGFAIHQYGVSAPIWFVAAANLLVFAALLIWRPRPSIATSSLPAERLTSAVSTGLRHAFNNRLLRATLVHAVAIFPFAAAYWGLLPLISGRADATPGFYGLLLSALSVGTIIGSFTQGRLREHLDDDVVVVLGGPGDGGGARDVRALSLARGDGRGVARRRRRLGAAPDRPLFLKPRTHCRTR